MSTEELTVASQEQFVFFWDGFMSNWHIARFVVDGQVYNCVEQYMMAEKARVFNDALVHAKILASPYPKAQKEFGRKIRGYDDRKWSSVRYNVVLKGTLAKYRQNKDLLEQLFRTEEKTLVEASPYDAIWGIGMAADDPDLMKNQSAWGQNLLGQVLMEARSILRGEAAC